ncbi:TetR/AcrR family transcriptional regulator [Actibacterium lipolyticum]|uniref:Bacterial regulatory proteins, tetR family n=1 Tax=Actibacterium lipolyticum TaxID=1524263 RepID=A0A238JJJ7_9RHOB|nr:TetR/AcrR family transcriptional regulator [Actibacterium lipolyticum]SMX30655.1 Bacterial regulatory proteins, tetR family [Actibacterium lipolyticum]
MNAVTDGIKKGRKFDQVLEGARLVFMQDGFEGASVDDIARAACVSKATLYSYFPDKRLLFMEVVKAGCEQQSEAALSLIDFEAPVPVVLQMAAEHLVKFFLSDFGKSVFRVSVAESDRFPELGQLFYESGPENACRKVADYLTKAVDRGDLVIEDIPFAAHQFVELCKVDLFPKVIFGVKLEFSEDEKNRVIRGAVDMFMARYGA